MKNTLLITLASVLFILTQCTSKNSASFDPEKEKALIMELFEKNNQIFIDGNVNELVPFMRKYCIDKSYTMTNDSLVFINIADSSDQVIYSWYAEGSTKVLSMDPYYPPVIKIFPD
jgi:hypothetical protein